MKKLPIIASAMLMATGSALGAELLAGADSMPAGTVNVTKDGGMLEVTFDAADPLLIFEAHAAAGAIEEGYCDVPQTRKGNPKVGKFEEQEEVGVPGTDSLTLNVNNVFQDGETICVAAHAVVYDPSLAGDDPDNLTGCDTNDDDVVSDDEAFECSEETAWGDGIEFEGKSWATWFEFCVPGDNDVVNSVDIGDAADSILNASAVSLDGEGDALLTGSVGYCADIGDYYVITAPASGSIDLALTGLEEDLDLILREVGGSFSPLAASENSGNSDEFISYEAVGGTSYIIEVIPYLSAASGYALAIEAPAVLPDAELEITSPGAISGTYPGIKGVAGPQSFELIGQEIVPAEPLNADTALTNDLTGKVALVASDGFAISSFNKANNAAANGAVAVIIYNSEQDSLVPISGSNLIPTIFIGKTAGEAILANQDVLGNIRSLP